MAENREQYLKECPAYGWTEDGGAGYDTTTEECRKCLEQAPDMANACEAEAVAGQKAYDAAQEAALKVEKEEDAKTAAEKAERDAAAAAEKKARKEAVKAAAEKPAAQEPAQAAEPPPVEEPTDPAEPTTTPEPVQEADKGPSAIEIIVEVLKRGKPATSQEIQAEIVKRRGCAKGTAAVYVGECLKFGLLLGVLTKDGKVYTLDQG